MEKLSESVFSLGMGSLVGLYGNKGPLAIVAYGHKVVTTKKGEEVKVLVVATEEGELLATRSGGLLHQWSQLEEYGLPDVLTVKVRSKEIDSEDYPAGATTWEFVGVYKQGASAAAGAE